MGVGLSLIIGLVTFTVGVSLFPVELPPPPAPPPRAPVATPPVAPSTPPPPPSGSDAGGEAGHSADGGDGSAGGGSEPHASAKDSPEEAPTAAAAVATPATRRSKASRDKEKEKEAADASATEDATTGAGGESGATTASGDDADGGTLVAPPADCTLSDKDIAHEAWRHNWPTICPIPDSGKAFIVIPVKGSIENAVVELKRKPVREARVTVPSAESLLTLKLYKLRRLGFKDLKIGPTDDGTGTRFRVRLMNGAGDPAFDVKDGYAKITVASPPE